MSDTAAVVAAVLTERHRRMREALALLPTDEVAGHKRLRTTARRLRSDLRCLRALIDPITVSALGARARAVSDGIGPARDLHLIAASLTVYARGLTLPGLDRLQETLAVEEAAARAVATAMLAGGAAERLTLDLAAIAAQPPLMDGGDSLLPAASVDVLQALARALRTAHLPLPDGRLHQLRIRTKRARYAVEVMQLRSPGQLWPLAPLRDLQDRLGEIQDAAVAAAWLEGHGHGPEGIVARRLAARARARGVARRVGLQALMTAALAAATEGQALCASC